MSFVVSVQALMYIKDSLKDPHSVLENWDRDSVDPCSWAMVTCSPENLVISLWVLLQIHHLFLAFMCLILATWHKKGQGVIWTCFEVIFLQRNSQPKLIWYTFSKYREFDQPWNCVSSHCLFSSLLVFCPSLNCVIVCVSMVGGFFFWFFRLLQNNNISGPIPPEIGKLSELKTLDLSNNYFTGGIPTSIGQLESLQYL